MYTNIATRVNNLDVSFIWDRDNRRHSIEFESEYALLTRFINEECSVSEYGIEKLNTLIDAFADEQDRDLRLASGR